MDLPARSGIKPGDIIFTRGVGAVGAIIRHGSQAPYGHCGIYHELLAQHHDLSETWLTAEAFGDGLRYRVRRIAPAPHDEQWRSVTVSVARSDTDRDAIVAASDQLVTTSTGYDYWELARIAARFVGIKATPADVDPTRHICSGHVSMAVTAARPEYAALSAVPLQGRWPGHVRELLTIVPGAREVRGYVPAGDPLPYDATIWPHVTGTAA